MKLPIEYNILSDFFDAVGSGSEASVNRFIGKILKQYHVKTVLDLTCGTGSQVIWLSKRGFKVVGSDYSPKLVAKAKQKLKQATIKAELFQGDMRSQQLGKFDAVITIFNAIGHVTKKGFEKTLKNIYKNLNPKGIYIFDIFNLDSLNDKDMSSFDVNKSTTVGNIKVIADQYSTLNKKKGLLVSHDSYALYSNTKKHKILKSKFPLQIYGVEELHKILNKNGFKVLKQYGRDGSRFSKKHSKEMLTIAQRVEEK